MLEALIADEDQKSTHRSAHSLNIEHETIPECIECEHQGQIVERPDLDADAMATQDAEAREIANSRLEAELLQEATGNNKEISEMLFSSRLPSARVHDDDSEKVPHNAPSGIFLTMLAEDPSSVRAYGLNKPESVHPIRSVEEGLCFEYALKNALKAANFDCAAWLISAFNAPAKLIETIAPVAMLALCNEGNPEKVSGLLKFLNLPANKLQKLLIHAVSETISKGRIIDAEVAAELARFEAQLAEQVHQHTPVRTPQIADRFLAAYKSLAGGHVNPTMLLMAMKEGFASYLTRETLVGSYPRSLGMYLGLTLPKVQTISDLASVVMGLSLLKGDFEGAKLISAELQVPEAAMHRGIRTSSLFQIVEAVIDRKIPLSTGISSFLKILRCKDSGETALYTSTLELLAGRDLVATSLRKLFPCRPELLEDLNIQNIALSAIRERLHKGDCKAVLNIIDGYRPNPDRLLTPEMLEAATACLEQALKSSYLEPCSAALVSAMNLPRAVVLKAVVPQYLRSKLTGDPSAATLKDTFKLHDDEITYHYYPLSIKSLCDNIGLDSFSKLSEFTNAQSSLTRFLFLDPKAPCRLQRGDIAAAKKVHIPLKEAEELIRAGVFLSEFSELITKPNLKEQSFTQLFALRAEHCSDWKITNTANWFRRGANFFGYESLFRFCERGDVTPHDMLFGIEKIISLCEASTLEKSRFIEQIMVQVKMDKGAYDAGQSYHQLNAIAGGMNLDFAKALENARKYPEFSQLQEVVQNFDTSEKIFESWKSLKRYHDLSKFLSRAEILEELVALRKSGQEKLYEYVQTLSFHESSGVNLGLVTSFWRTPAKFFEIEEGMACHRKKPSNYVHMPHLDLSPEQLRDALVNGALDNLQVFTPLRIDYEVPVTEIPYPTVRAALKSALGSSTQGIAGKARNSGKLFSEARKVLQQSSLELRTYLEGAEASVEQETALIRLVFDPKFGLPHERLKFTAEIHSKSDPLGVLAGNDTACCMPFGSGKNNVYTFNPNTVHFTVRIENGESGTRTIAQSVLTKDKDIKMLIPDALRQLERDEMNLALIVPEDILKEAPTFLACDNVEVAKNYKTGAYPRIVKMIYKDLFREYMRRFSQDQNLVPDKVVIGTNYSDTMTDLPQIRNTFAPLAPASYSDKTGEKVFVLDLNGPAELLFKTTTISEDPRISERKTIVRGVQQMDFTHTLAVSYLEGKVYDGNKALMVYLHDIENSLIASCINNRIKDRPNLNLCYVQEGKVHGYMTAYEGRHNGSDIEELKGTPIIYVSDIAARNQSRLAGGKLMRGLLELYREHYLENGNLIPVYGEYRESTSYKVLKAHLDTLGDKLGIRFEMIEYPTYAQGKDIMHPVLIKVREPNAPTH